MTRYATRDCSCPSIVTGTGGKRPEKCEHGNRYQTAAELAPPKPRKPLRAVSEKRAAEEAAGTRSKSRGGLKQGKGFAASKAQQAKVRDLPCVNCGRDRFEATIDPAHVCSRSLAPHCECPDGVVPLCRDCHRLYDNERSLDLMPKLMENGYRVEAVHAFIEHGVGLQSLIQHVTNSRASSAVGVAA